METLLLVENEVLVAMQTERALVSLGYEVITAHSGEEAIATAVEDENVALVLMAIDLGDGIDGIEAAQQILTQRHIPIVFHTAHLEARDVERIKAVTRYGYVSKQSDDLVLQSSLELAFELFNEHQKTRASEARYKKLLEGIQAGIVVHGKDSRILDCNSKAEELLGLTREQLLGIDVMDSVWNLLREDGTLMPPEEFPVMKALSEKQPVRDCVLAICRADDEDPVWLTISGIPEFDQDGNVSRVINTFMDITERKKAEEARFESERRLREAQHIAQIGSWDIDAQTGDGVWSDELFRLLGYERGEMAASYSLFRHHIHPDDVHKFEESITAYTSRVKHVDETFRFRTTSGETRVAHALGRVEFDEQGTPLRTYGTFQDITERKKAEEALRESENRATALLNAIPDMMFRLDRDGVYLDYKAARSDLYAQDIKIIGAKCRDVLPSEFAELTESFIRKTLATDEIQIFEYQLPVTEKGLHDYEARMVPSGEDEVTVIVRDITERKQAEEEIKKFKAIADHANYGVAIVDVEGWVLYINTYFAQVHGYQTDELLGKHLTVFHNEGQLDDVKRINQMLLESGSYEAVEIWHTHKNGTVFPMLMNGVVIHDDAGKPRFMTATAIDITERKKVEEELRMYARITDVVDDSLAFVTPDYVYRIVNAAYTSYYNVPTEEVVGCSPADFVGEDVFEREIKPKLERGFSGESVRYQFWVDFSTVGRRFVEMHYYPLWADDGTILGAISHGHDLTAEKELQEQLRQANETKDKFFSIIAHDLRTPFIALDSGTELLQEHFQGSDDAYALKISHELHQSSTQLLKLLDNLLEWSRIQRGLVPFKPHTIDLYSAVRYVLRLLDTSAQQKHIQVRHSVPEGIEVYADYDMLQLILRNLISNAIKFTPEGGTVDVTAADKAAVVAISVKDNGIGIRADKLPRLFKSGERHISSRGTLGERGTGLGLILCQEFVEQHGGQVWVESEEGKGSTFTFTLPKTKGA